MAHCAPSAPGRQTLRHTQLEAFAFSSYYVSAQNLLETQEEIKKSYICVCYSIKGSDSAGKLL